MTSLSFSMMFVRWLERRCRLPEKRPRSAVGQHKRVLRPITMEIAVRPTLTRRVELADAVIIWFVCLGCAVIMAQITGANTVPHCYVRAGGGLGSAWRASLHTTCNHGGCLLRRQDDVRAAARWVEWSGVEWSGGGFG